MIDKLTDVTNATRQLHGETEIKPAIAVVRGLTKAIKALDDEGILANELARQAPHLNAKEISMGAFGMTYTVMPVGVLAMLWATVMVKAADMCSSDGEQPTVQTLSNFVADVIGAGEDAHKDLSSFQRRTPGRARDTNTARMGGYLQNDFLTTLPLIMAEIMKLLQMVKSNPNSVTISMGALFAGVAAIKELRPDVFEQFGDDVKQAFAQYDE